MKHNWYMHGAYISETVGSSPPIRTNKKNYKMIYFGLGFIVGVIITSLVMNYIINEF